MSDKQDKQDKQEKVDQGASPKTGRYVETPPIRNDWDRKK